MVYSSNPFLLTGYFACCPHNNTNLFWSHIVLFIWQKWLQKLRHIAAPEWTLPKATSIYSMLLWTTGAKLGNAHWCESAQQIMDLIHL